MGTSSRKLILEMKNSYNSKLTHRTVLECSPDFPKANGIGVQSSSAVELMEWLRREASNPNHNLSYKVLSYQGKAIDAAHSTACQALDPVMGRGIVMWN